jgi:futalosine hydrolase
MSFRILYVAATQIEAEVLRGIMQRDELRIPDKLEVSTLVTGVGSVATAWMLMNWFRNNPKPDLVINAGIAGSYRDEIRIGDVILVRSDCFADSGIDADGEFTTLFEAGFAGKDDFPYRNGILIADESYLEMFKHNFLTVNAITLNTSTGSDVTKSDLLKKFNPDIETMEGATFFYICSREKVPFLAVRAISNIVEKRNKDKWNITLALDNLSLKLFEIFLILQGRV